MFEQDPEDPEVLIWRTKSDEPDEPDKPWQPGPKHLHTIHGMIIDRNWAWRVHPTWGPLIDGAIRKGLKNLDEDAFYRIYNFLWNGGLPGSYETRGFDEQQMERAWHQYLQRHYQLKPKPEITPELEAQGDLLQEEQTEVGAAQENSL
jgi:hypothetical protein